MVSTKGISPILQIRKSNAGQSGMNCNASVHDVPMLRYCSVLGELSYIKGKVHENNYVPDAEQAREI